MPEQGITPLTTSIDAAEQSGHSSIDQSDDSRNVPATADSPALPTVPTEQIASAESVEPVAELTFDHFGLHADVLRAVKEQGYTRPTPIQAQAIPVVLSGRDIMGAAQTGTGKTASFSLPIIQRLLPLASSSASPARHPVRALILTPTRELADQVADNVAAYAKHTALRSIVVFGGVDMKAQAAELRRGVEILIATPGRLLDHVEQRNTQLGQVQMLVLDEADRMLDMGFLPDLQRILNLLPKERQTLLFSATFSGEIKKLAATYLRDPLTIEVARSNATATNVRQILFEVEEADKPRAITHLIRERQLKQVIVFCNSKLGASRLARVLERDGIVASAIHGDKTQNERMQALDAFKRGEMTALVATDVAARGLDIAELPAVINFDLPFNAEDYVHRIGRTGRAGASGDALSLCSPKEARLLVDIEKMIKRPLEREALNLAPLPREQWDRGDRNERSDARAPRVERRPADDSRPAARPARASSVGSDMRGRRSGPAVPIDDIFTLPYVPSPNAKRATEQDAENGLARRTTKRPLAALLGGIPRKPS